MQEAYTYISEYQQPCPCPCPNPYPDPYPIAFPLVFPHSERRHLPISAGMRGCTVGLKSVGMLDR